MRNTRKRKTSCWRSSEVQVFACEGMAHADQQISGAAERVMVSKKICGITFQSVRISVKNSLLWIQGRWRLSDSFSMLGEAVGVRKILFLRA